MKNLLLNLSTFFLIVGLLAFTACKKDETPTNTNGNGNGGGGGGNEQTDPPTLSIVDDIDSITALVGTDASTTLSITAPGGFSKLVISGDVNEEISDIDQGATTFDYIYEYSIPSSDQSSIKTLNFKVVDSEGRESNTVSFEVVAKAVPLSANNALQIYEDPEKHLINSSFYDVFNNKTFSLEEINKDIDGQSPNIDFLFTNSDEVLGLSSPSVHAPEEYSPQIWADGSKNITIFKPISGAKYLEVITELKSENYLDAALLIDDVFNSSEETSNVFEAVEADNYAVFQLDDARGGARGVIYFENNQSPINIEVVVSR